MVGVVIGGDPVIRSAFSTQGFMKIYALSQVLRNDQFPPSVMKNFIKDFISLMMKFEIVLLLDKKRLLIPSLLPREESEACLVLPSSDSDYSEPMLQTLSNLSNCSYANISSLPSSMTVIGRYYLLPYVPNGFFPHLIARLMGSNISKCLSLSLVSYSTGPLDAFNNLHWRCWRNGIMLLWRHMEIFRIAPVTLPPSGVDHMVVITTAEQKNIKQGQRAIEIKLALLPEDQVMANEFLPEDDTKSRSAVLSTWLLHQATDIIDSVFNDWYEAFTRRAGIDVDGIERVCACVECLRNTLTNQYHLETSVNLSPTRMSASVDPYSWKYCYLFSSPHCVLQVSRSCPLVCPQHDNVSVHVIAPDLVSATPTSHTHQPPLLGTLTILVLSSVIL